MKLIKILSLLSLFSFASVEQTHAFSIADAWQTIKDHKVISAAVVVSTLGVCALGYIVYKRHNTDKKPTVPQQQEPELPAITPSVTPAVASPVFQVQVNQVDQTSVVQEEPVVPNTDSPDTPSVTSSNNNNATGTSSDSQESSDEQPDTPSHGSKKQKKTLTWATDSQLSPTACVRNTIPTLGAFLDVQLEDIENRLRRVNTKNLNKLITSGIDFVIVGPLPETIYTQKIETFQKLIQQELTQTTDKEYKSRLKIELQKYLEKLTEMSDSIRNIVIRISDNPDAFYKEYVDSLKHLTNVKIELDGAYDALGLNKKNRYDITLEEIQKAYKDLSEQYGNTTTPEGKRVRQAGFTLANAFGKEIYDAYLTGPEAVEMLRISTSDADLFDINFQALSQEVGTYKNTLAYLIRKLSQ